MWGQGGEGPWPLCGPGVLSPLRRVFGCCQRRGGDRGSPTGLSLPRCSVLLPHWLCPRSWLDGGSGLWGQPFRGWKARRPSSPCGCPRGPPAPLQPLRNGSRLFARAAEGAPAPEPVFSTRDMTHRMSTAEPQHPLLMGTVVLTLENVLPCRWNELAVMRRLLLYTY